jgi:uncharacterized protein
MKERFLIVHGLGGSGPEHWQTWLAGRLREREVSVSYPALPNPDEPKLSEWIAALTLELDGLGPEGLVVACHSLGAASWLHLAARTERRLADRVLLVAPPSAGSKMAEIAEFVPAPLEGPMLAQAAGSTRVVCADEGDPYCPEGPVLWEPLAVPIDLIQGGGHLNTDAGFGEWPAVERWCLDPGAAPIAGR